MPRKPKVEKQTITVVVNGKPVAVILHPPTAARKSWYAYWPGLLTSKSTGQSKLENAVIVAEDMVKNGGKKATVADAVLTDEEFEAIQVRHFSKKTDPAAKFRSKKTLGDCLEAIAAFRTITGLMPVTAATPDDCARFQHQALTLPRNWRQHGSKGDKGEKPLSPNTVLKWSRSLMAAFERANRNAARRRCVRGVVEVDKLLNSNPWNQFDWIHGTQRPIRQFDSDDLLSLLTFLEEKWGGITVGAIAAKVFLWSGCRKLEVASLRWEALRLVGKEYHFEIVGKWGVERWFRIPGQVYRELCSVRTASPFVFAAYNVQLRRFHVANPGRVNGTPAEYNPTNFGSWIYQRIVDWSKTHEAGAAYVHIFRKTTLQYARRGEDINRQVADDARVSESVLMTNYVKETDEERRQSSNRTFHRILASLAPEVARRYGHVEAGPTQLEQQVQAAIAAKNWTLASALSARLAQEVQAEEAS